MEGMLTDEQIQFAQSLDRFVDQEYGRGSAAPAHAFDRGRLVRAAELGCLSLAIPESHGGFGGAVEAMIVMERLASGLPKEPILCSGIHAAALISAALPHDQAANLLPGLADGSLIATVAHQEARARFQVDHVGADAEFQGGRWALTGTKHLVDFAAEADVLLVTARDRRSGAFGLFRVENHAPGLAIIPRQRVDDMPCADIRLEQCIVQADALIANANVEAMVEAARDRAEAAQVAEMVGLMDALVRETIAYVQTRRQFGVEIGKFQALQHRIADMWMACEESRSLALAAALACTGSEQERRRTVSMAKIFACDSAQRIANEAVQMHGGIGMTDELILSHWYKRLLALRSSLGDRRFHIQRLTEDALAG